MIDATIPDKNPLEIISREDFLKDFSNIFSMFKSKTQALVAVDNDFKSYVRDLVQTNQHIDGFIFNEFLKSPSISALMSKAQVNELIRDDIVYIGLTYRPEFNTTTGKIVNFPALQITSKYDIEKVFSTISAYCSNANLARPNSRSKSVYGLNPIKWAAEAIEDPSKLREIEGFLTRNNINLTTNEIYNTLRLVDSKIHALASDPNLRENGLNILTNELERENYASVSIRDFVETDYRLYERVMSDIYQQIGVDEGDEMAININDLDVPENKVLNIPSAKFVNPHVGRSLEDGLAEDKRLREMIAERKSAVHNVMESYDKLLNKELEDISNKNIDKLNDARRAELEVSKFSEKSLVSRAIDTTKSDLSEAAKRTAVAQTIKLIREPLVNFLAAQMGNTKKKQKSAKKFLHDFLASDFGEAFLFAALGTALEVVPLPINDTTKSSLAQEFRVQGYTKVGISITDIVTEPVIEMLKSLYTSDLAATIANVRVEEAQPEPTKELESNEELEFVEAEAQKATA